MTQRYSYVALLMIAVSYACSSNEPKDSPADTSDAGHLDTSTEASTVETATTTVDAETGVLLDGAETARDTSSDAVTSGLVFSSIDYPLTDEAKRQVLASSQVTVNGTPHTIGFQTILRSGQTAGSGVFGRLYKSDGTVLTAADSSERISDDNDHSTLLDVSGKVFMVSQFESRPGGFYITELSQNTTTGALTPVSTKPIDMSAIGGGWVHCAGSRTPWKSHLGSEEYEPDARLVNPTTGVKTEADGTTTDTYYGAMGDYFSSDMTQVNPYKYGYIIEAKVTGPDLGSATFASNVAIDKHYSMGRIAFELGYVMPDEKTVYLTDDGSMVGLYMYKATNAKDLTEGTLYAAKLTQTAAENGGTYTLSWINLGSATDAEVKGFITQKVVFADIFDAITPTKAAVDAGGAYSCPDGYTGVSHGHALLAGKTNNECLKLKTTNDKGMSQAQIEKAASRLETRRYAVLKGATMELNKEEGITYDPDHKKLYLAMSDVTGGMKGNTSGAASATEGFSPDHIKVSDNRCGVVYELDVDAAFEATTMRPLVWGSNNPDSADAGSPFFGNTCRVDGIANPDNVTYIPGKGVLIIGEDTGSGHQNDLIWAYDLATKQLTRILSTPYGSETTSPYFYPNINGWGYMMTVVQHPYGESDQTKEPDALSSARRAYTGYVGPFPLMQ